MKLSREVSEIKLHEVSYFRLRTLRMDVEDEIKALKKHLKGIAEQMRIEQDRQYDEGLDAHMERRVRGVAKWVKEN